MPADVRVEGAAEPPVLDVLHDALARLWASAPDVPSAERARFETAVLELATNALVHGVPGGAGPVRVGATLRAGDDGVLAAVLWDDGGPLDVDLDAPEPPDTATSGRGLLLVRRAVDSVVLTREGERNVWRLARRYRDPEPHRSVAASSDG